MKIFEVKQRHQAVNSAMLSWSFVILTYGHVLFWGAFFNWSIQHWLLAEILIISMIPIFLLVYPDKAVYKILFDDDKRICTICFYRLLIFKRSCDFRYDELMFRYVPTRYLRGVFVNSFQILKRGRLRFEIRQKYNVGWEKEDILEMNKYVKGNPLIKYDTDALKRRGALLLPE
ncbi:hypothetical protein SAMN05660909_02598 [Chitinophaga terrae (ex Kim and Jung 2007)]|uniref:Uncharacterized protein n=1 Tax=Chitinophaga terrae (ex Kim and Jung 2007) TaxID=408074 RepID=A0A1H4CEV6_9BACT|nr:hypothetical protein [Chitinophaga terrae (ex Kim and Jung 2007)]GEP88939.1 hypothetical protein CTE07_05840 [Chitinophaga terrae (ex Kim and Jung 2007)]SEA58965.1 hypothetical protein SAMN05660909_02598 [Chitinophaga terrae (ex Kim and Jung 2007)]